MRPARCNLRAAATLPKAAAQAAARNMQRVNRIVIYMIVRAIAFMFIHTQHASEIAENSVALLVKIQLKYVQFGADCGLRPVACGKV